MTRRVGAVLLLLLALVASACGDDPPPEVKPADVPDGLVPETVQDGQFAFFESELPTVKRTFANAGPKSLAADGRLWELRKGDRLVGSLQITSLMPEVDLTRKEHRNMILHQLLPTARDQVLIDEVNVWSMQTSTKAISLWFGKDMYALMTLKGGSEDDLDPDLILSEVVAYTAASDDWRPLYLDDEIEV